jgi:hypothetical protein
MNQNQPNLHYSPFLVVLTMMRITLLLHCHLLLPSSRPQSNLNLGLQTKAKEKLLPPARVSKLFLRRVHLGVPRGYANPSQGKRKSLQSLLWSHYLH